MTRVLLVEDHRGGLYAGIGFGGVTQYRLGMIEGLGVAPQEAGPHHELGDFASLTVYERLNQ